MSLTLVDFGKNLENVLRITRFLRRSEESAYR